MQLNNICIHLIFIDRTKETKFYFRSFVISVPQEPGRYIFFGISLKEMNSLSRSFGNSAIHNSVTLNNMIFITIYTTFTVIIVLNGKIY